MKLSRACLALPLMALVASGGGGLRGADLVGDNLFASGNLDVNGNTASFGTNGLNAGYTILYTPGSPAGVYFSASAPGVDWSWGQATRQTQLKLDSTNKLKLYARGNLTLPQITLDPGGVSTFAKGLSIAGPITQGGQPVATLNQLAGYATTAQLDARLARYQLATGDGSGLTALDAGRLATGALPAERVADASLPLAKLAVDPLARANHTGSQPWSTLSSTPSTLAGYGITDALPKTPAGDVVVPGTLTLQGAVTVKTVLRVPPAGDLSMGSFTQGPNPAE